MSLVPYNIVVIAENDIIGNGKNVVVNASVDIKYLDGTIVNDIYVSDLEGSPLLTRPFFTNSSGEFMCYIDAGAYEVIINGKSYKVDISSDKFDTKQSVSAVENILEPSWAGKYLRIEVNIPTVININPVSTTPQVQGSIWTIKNTQAELTTIQADEDVFFIGHFNDLGGGSFILQPNDCIEIRYIGNDNYDITFIESNLLTVLDSDLGFDLVVPAKNPEGGERNYSIRVARDGGSESTPDVRVKSISKNGLTTYFDVGLVTENKFNNYVLSANLINESSDTFSLEPFNRGSHIRATYNGAKTMNIEAESSKPQVSGARFILSNRNDGDLTVVPAVGVTINKLTSVSLIIPKNATVLIIRVAENEYDFTTFDGDAAEETGDLVVDINDLGFTLSALSADAEGGARNYFLTVARNGGSATTPSIRVKAESVDMSETYFDEELALKQDILRRTVFDISDQNFNLEPFYRAQFLRATYNGAKNLTIQPNEDNEQQVGSFWNIANRSNGNLTIVLGDGVTVNKAALKSLSIPQYGFVIIQCIAINVYDLIFVEGDDFGLGGNAYFLAGTTVDSDTSRATGFYYLPTNYAYYLSNQNIIGERQIPTRSPLIHVNISDNYAAQIDFLLPSNSEADDGDLIYRDKTGANWRTYKRILTNTSALYLSNDPIYEESVTVSGISIYLRLWGNIKAKECYGLAIVSGTASSAITGNTSFPDLNGDFSPYFPGDAYGYVSLLLHAGSFGTLQTLAGCINIDSTGVIKFSVLNGAVFSNACTGDITFRCGS